MSIFGEEILPSVQNAKHVSQISQRNRSFIFLSFRMHIIGTIGWKYFWDRNPSFTRYLQSCVFNNEAFSRNKPLLSPKISPFLSSLLVAKHWRFGSFSQQFFSITEKYENCEKSSPCPRLEKGLFFGSQYCARKVNLWEKASLLKLVK